MSAMKIKKKKRKKKKEKKGTSVLHRSFNRKKEKNLPHRESYQTNLHIVIGGAGA